MATEVGIDIERIVEKPTWKQVLMDLIITERLDPWNIDIVKIADAFLKKVRNMKKLDLFIPANIILASAILLRYKSTYLKLYEPQPEVMAAPDEGPMEMEQIPVLSIASRIPPKRQITLEELSQELENAIKYEGAVYTPKHKGGISEFVDFKLSGEDIEKTMNDVYEKLRANRDENGWVLFSNIVRGVPAIETIYTLMSILHLTQNEKIDLKQEKIFGELFIYVIDASQGVSNKENVAMTN